MDAESSWYVSKGRLTFLTVLAALFWVLTVLEPDRWWQWVAAGLYTAFIAVSWVVNLRVDGRRRREHP